MLARVAENMYWTARYLERAEDMARLINVNSNLLLDLPRGIAPGWRPLVTIVGADAAFEQKYGAAHDETRVMRFLVGDRDHSQSILSVVASARDNARSFRDAIPREVWEEINGLYHFARDQVGGGLTKRGRFPFLAEIIRRNQTITGLLAGCMNHDEGYFFFQLGRKVERADMTTRIVDVRSADLIAADLTELRPFDTIQWVSVLKSLTGYQMYRQEMQVPVRRTEVLRFLLGSTRFPRSVRYCLDDVGWRVKSLADGEPALVVLDQLQAMLADVAVADLSGQALHDFIDELQVGFGALHTELHRVYFLPRRDETL